MNTKRGDDPSAGTALADLVALAAESQALRVERDELAAKVDHLAKSIPCTVRQYRHNNDNSPNLFSPEHGFVIAYEREAVDHLLAETPAQSLAHIKAQAVTDALEYATGQVGSDDSAESLVDAICEHLENLSDGKFPTVGSTGNPWRSIRATGAREALQRAMEEKGFSKAYVSVNTLQTVIADMESGL